MSRLTPIGDTEGLIGSFNSLNWATDRMKKHYRNSVRQLWKELVETYGRKEAESLAFLVLLGRTDTETANYDLYVLTNIGDSEEETEGSEDV